MNHMEGNDVIRVIPVSGMTDIEVILIRSWAIPVSGGVIPSAP